MSIGALTALIVLVVASVLFGFYVTTFSNYAKNYGSLAGVVIFLLWLWIANLALLFGAELDAEVERTRQLRGGIEGAEDDVQLPPRDAKKSAKSADKEEKDVADGRRIREERGEGGAGGPPHPRGEQPPLTSALPAVSLRQDLVP